MGEQPKAKMLDEETHHRMYSEESAMEHYKKDVYYRQRPGGPGDWFYGRVSNKYRNNYDNIKWNN